MLTHDFGVPAVFGENLFEDWIGKAFSDFGDLDRAFYGKSGKSRMKTDVKESEDAYEVAMELPGFDRDEISAELDQGYLTVSASKNSDREETQEDGRYLRRERFLGTMQRSFYVGEGVKREDIRAKYENGVLKLEIPKKELQKLPENKTIAIEG
ncbi:MAG: Hsp20/alpha crystallin family protein [bacterium]|nr:Hsp20/alpha crystallin family protein [bacterium]